MRLSKNKQPGSPGCLIRDAGRTPLKGGNAYTGVAGVPVACFFSAAVLVGANPQAAQRENGAQ